MKRVILFVVIVVAVGIGWYLAAPLFINSTVNEALPPIAPPPSALLDPDSTTPPPPPQPGTPQPTAEPAAVPPAASAPATTPTALRRGEFRDADKSHRGSGVAAIYQLADGKRILRFENFSVTNGPDLRVLLARHPQPATSSDLEGMVELARLKGNIGNQNYEIPKNLDLDQFRSVVIYCKPFRVIFSTATLAGA